MLTLALPDVGMELVQSSHGDLSDLRVKQELHQGGGDVFTGRHAGSLGHFTLRERQRQRGEVSRFCFCTTSYHLSVKKCGWIFFLGDKVSPQYFFYSF